MGPTATWRPTQQNHPAKQLDGQTRTVLRVGWLRMSGFRVALPNPDAVDSWMVKNGLYSKVFNTTSLEKSCAKGTCLKLRVCLVSPRKRKKAVNALK